jgi:hypothetical protein
LPSAAGELPVVLLNSGRKQSDAIVFVSSSNVVCSPVAAA